MTQKYLFLCLISTCLPEIIMEFWLLVSLLTVCIETLIILELQLYNFLGVSVCVRGAAFMRSTHVSYFY